MRTILIGESHSAPFRSIAKHDSTKEFQAFMLTKQKNGSTVGDVPINTLSVVLKPLRESDLAVSVVGGNQYAILGTLQHHRHFDLLERSTKKLNCEIIPVRAIEELFGELLKNKEESKIRAIKEATAARVAHLSPPPPKDDNNFILKHHETLFAQQGISEKGISTPELRLKLWKIQDRMIRKMCAKLDIIFVPPPAETVDPSGFLVRQFYGPDSTHANIEYARRVITQLHHL